MATSILLEFLKTLAALWHTLAFAGGLFFVWQSYRAVFGQVAHDSRWGRIIRKADIHLWLSGFAIIAMGMLISGADKYLDNPKLWTKVVLITVWLIATQAMRRYALPRFKAGQRAPLLATAAISLACWIYGAFLGVAQGLAYGVIPFAGLLSGYLLATVASLLATFALEMNRQRAPSCSTGLS